MSTIKSDVVNFLIDLDVINHNYTKNTISYDGSNLLVSTLLGVKYHIELDDRDIKNYTEYYNLDNSKIYLNKYALNVGFMADEKILDYKSNKKNGLDNINNIYYYSSNHKPVLKEIKLDKYNDGYSFNNNEDKDLIALFKFKNWYTYSDLKVYVDGNNVSDDNENYMYHINNKYNEGEINFSYFLQDYNKKDLVGIYLYYFDKEAFEEDVEILKKNQFNVDKVKKNTISGTIDVDNSNILFTTIPYDDDLHIYVDGKEQPKIKLLDTFIGAKLNKGHHDIEIRYIPSIIYKSFIPSIISILLMTIYLNIDKIKDKIIPKKKKKYTRKKKA
jgi:uncharacterized membrane protein YfhO